MVDMPDHAEHASRRQYRPAAACFQQSFDASRLVSHEDSPVRLIRSRGRRFFALTVLPVQTRNRAKINMRGITKSDLPSCRLVCCEFYLDFESSCIGRFGSGFTLLGGPCCGRNPAPTGGDWP